MCDDKILVDIKAEAAIRDEIRREMTMHRRGTGRKAVLDAAYDIYEVTGYDLRQHARDRALERGVAADEAAEAAEDAARIRKVAERIAAEHVRAEAVRVAIEERRHIERMENDRIIGNAQIQAVSEALGVAFEVVEEQIRPRPVGPFLAIMPSPDQEDRRIRITNELAVLCGAPSEDEETASAGDVSDVDIEGEHTECDHKARVLPRFVAAVACALRGKFGHMSGSEANRMLIEREYLKLCRETDIRNVDAATHQQWVLNTYFNEGVMEHLATTRSRLPKWLAQAFGSNPVAAPTIC